MKTIAWTLLLIVLAVALTKVRRQGLVELAEETYEKIERLRDGVVEELPNAEEGLRKAAETVREVRQALTMG